MSRHIAQIIYEPERLVTKTLKELEEKNGFPSHDARFLAENIQRARIKIADLGLDPDDTTGPELYHALQAKFAKNSRLFDLHYAAEDMDFDQKSAKAAQLVENNFEVPRQWSIKPTAAKKVLQALPPKNVMKFLGYRSAASMLKREKAAELLMTANYLESVSWQKAHQRLVQKLSQTDFDLRPLAILSLSYGKWSLIDGPENFIETNYEIGAVAIWPAPELKNASLLDMTLLLSEGLKLKNQTKLSGVLDWWSGMDHLIAELKGDHVSLNLADNSLSSLMNHTYQERQLKSGRGNFWRQLISRYENVPPAEALFDVSAIKKIKQPKLKTPDLVFELAEDFDGYISDLCIWCRQRT